MHATHLLVAGAALAAFGWFASSTNAPPGPATPPSAQGHYALVVEGDRDRLTITHGNAKADAWAGVPKGFTSAWTLTVLGAGGEPLAEVPLDVSPFDVGQDRKGGPVQVEGCIVRDPKVAMLVNVPRFAEASAYVFERQERDGTRSAVGRVEAEAVRELAGGGR
jgi:hypothetical protein